MFKAWSASARRRIGAAACTAALVAGVASPASALVVKSEGDSLGSVQGDVRFDCILEPFKSGFMVQGPASVQVAEGAQEGTVALTAAVPDIPGIAPVAIENGTMHVHVDGKVNGQPMQLTSTSTVNAEPKTAVPVPELTGTMEGDAEGATVELTGFGFEFDEMMNIVISADCEATEGASLGALESADEGDDAAGGQEAADAAGEEGAELPVIALWVVLGLVVVGGLAVWLPRRHRA